MKRVAIAFSTKDRTELTEQTVRPLLKQPFDLWWFDGSRTEAGENLPYTFNDHRLKVVSNVRGGPDRAIVHALSTLIDRKYDYIGLVENDVLLHDGWYEPTMALFEEGARQGLKVGAVSARCYEDRILCQREGFALMHNLGAGMTVFTREAAQLVLWHFRTGRTTENRAIFAQLSDLDIGAWWAFGTSDHMLCADWGFDRVLAAHGLASLALTPARCEMIGQDPPLAQQGLVLARDPVRTRQHDAAFGLFAERTTRIRNAQYKFPPQALSADGMVYPYQLLAFDDYSSAMEGYRTRWLQGFGPFAFQAEVDSAQIFFSVAGLVTVILSGGPTGGRAQIRDSLTNWTATPNLLADEGNNMRLLQVQVPPTLLRRTILLTLDKGTTFHSVVVSPTQLINRNWRFHVDQLPPAG